MSQLAKFYNKIFDYSLKRGTHIKFVDMIKYRGVNSNNIIPIMTKHIYNEIPIRLAKRVTDLNSLPFGLSKNHSINRIREWYLLSFEELTQIKEPRSNSDIIDFKNKISTIYDRHSTTLSTISKGLYELQIENKINDIEAPVIQLFLNKFHKNRTEIRILLEQYLSFFEKSKGEIRKQLALVSITVPDGPPSMRPSSMNRAVMAAIRTAVFIRLNIAGVPSRAADSAAVVRCCRPVEDRKSVV